MQRQGDRAPLNCGRQHINPEPAAGMDNELTSTERPGRGKPRNHTCQHVVRHRHQHKFTASADRIGCDDLRIRNE